MSSREQPTRVLREFRKRPRRLSDASEPLPYLKVSNLASSTNVIPKAVESAVVEDESKTTHIHDAITTSSSAADLVTLTNSHSIENNRPLEEISVATAAPTPAAEVTLVNSAEISLQPKLVEKLVEPQHLAPITTSTTTTTTTTTTTLAATNNTLTMSMTAPAAVSTMVSTRSDPQGISATAAAAAATAAVAPSSSGTEVFVSTSQATSSIYSRSINPFSTQFALATLSWAPLHLASLKGDVSLVRALCSSGVNVNARTVTDGKTALSIAVEQGWVAVADELLQRGASL
jgi:hypothetical protein